MFTSPEHLGAFRNFLNGQHTNVLVKIENEKQNRMSFLDVKAICEEKYLALLSTINLTLAEFLHILTAFYHLPRSFVLFTRSLIDRSEYTS